MNDQIKSFLAEARTADFVVKFRDRNGRLTLTAATINDAALDSEDLTDLHNIAFKHNLSLEVTKDGTYHTNLLITIGKATKTTTNVASDLRAPSPPTRLPNWQYAIVKSVQAGERARDRLQEVIDSGDIDGTELDLLEEHLHAQEKLNAALMARVNFYKINAYL